MKDGVIQQVGTPKEVYDLPENVFAGGFIGSPAMNFITGVLEKNRFRAGSTILPVPEGKMKLLLERGYLGKNIILGVRPEHIHRHSTFIENGSVIVTQVDGSELTGAELMINASLEGQGFVARLDADAIIKRGDRIRLAFNMNKVHFFDFDTELRIQ